MRFLRFDTGRCPVQTRASSFWVGSFAKCRSTEGVWALMAWPLTFSIFRTFLLKEAGSRLLLESTCTELTLPKRTTRLIFWWANLFPFWQTKDWLDKFEVRQVHRFCYCTGLPWQRHPILRLPGPAIPSRSLAQIRGAQRQLHSLEHFQGRPCLRDGVGWVWSFARRQDDFQLKPRTDSPSPEFNF